MAHREPPLIDVAQPPLSAPRRVNAQGHDIRCPQVLRGGYSDGGDGEPMGLRESWPGSVPFGQTP
jgi:hypothetical protein